MKDERKQIHFIQGEIMFENVCENAHFWLGNLYSAAPQQT